MSTWKKYGYVWVTMCLFLISLIGHWFFGWLAYKDEQENFNAPIKVADYVEQMSRDTLENWQSEFLQLAWQIAGLSFLIYASSPQSKNNTDRQEEKIDELMKLVNQKEAEKIIRKLDSKYLRK